MKTLICHLGFMVAAWSAMTVSAKVTEKVSVTVVHRGQRINTDHRSPIPISQIHSSLIGHPKAELDRTAPEKLKFACFPVKAMRFRNEKGETMNVWMCIGSRSWNDYEIEKDCEVRFFDTLKGVTIPKGEEWLFDEEARNER